jgi:magnesium transporter
MTPPQRDDDRPLAALLAPDLVALLEESPASVAAETEELHPRDLAARVGFFGAAAKDGSKTK